MHPIHTSPKVVMISGGTGGFTLLNALKYYVQDLTSLVSMADDGGSSGSLRDELGVLPPGDVRQCLVALSEDSMKMRELFNYRFTEGKLAGHSFGNIFLSAVEKMTNDFGEAVQLASEVLNITGTVVPITLDNTRLELIEHDGTVVSGEYAIDYHKFKSVKERPQLRLTPPATINPIARQAILDADIIILPSGDLYTSIGPALMVKGVREALLSSPAKLVYVCNLVTKAGQTDGLDVAGHAAEIERFIGRPRLDYVLCNTDKPDQALIKRYALKGAHPVQVNKAELKKQSYQVVYGSFLSHAPVIAQTHNRSYIRHDGNAVSRAIMQLIYAT